jgi:hypothetical protein
MLIAARSSQVSLAVHAQTRARDGLPSGLQLTIRSSDEDHNSTYGRVAIFAMRLLEAKPAISNGLKAEGEQLVFAENAPRVRSDIPGP